MKPVTSKVILIAVSLLFSAGLIFATLELPSVFDSLVQDTFKFPGFDQASSTLQMSKAELYSQHLHIKTIGYISLILIFSLVVIGFATNKLKLSVLGAVALFIPIFGHFTVTMFFLAGLSFLRFLWIPFTDLSPILMHLGDILILPNQWIQDIGRWMHVDLQFPISVCFISAGTILFVAGVYNWLYSKLNQAKVVTSWTYRISRHPQYLGWILWTYGLYLLPVDAQKRVWSYHDSLPLLLTIMIIITIALFEELKMQKKYGKEYTRFKSNTSFMFPLPDVVKKIIKHPVRIFFGNYAMDSKRKALVFSGYYTVLLMLLSYVYLSISNPDFSNKLTEHRHLKHMEEYISDLKASGDRRSKDIAAMNLSAYGDLAVDPLLELIPEVDANTNNFVVRTLGEIGNPKGCEALYHGFQSGEITLSYEVIMALGKLRCPQFEHAMINEIRDPDSDVRSYAVWYLGQVRSEAAVGDIIAQYPRDEKYNQMAFLEALGNIGDKRAVDLITSELNNTDPDIIEAAIIALAGMHAEEAVPSLAALKDHGNWEVRLYAEQAIKTIEK